MKLEESWEERYQRKETGWQRPGLNPACQHWIDSGALAPCSVIIPGCGRSHELVGLAELGFQVTGLDLASTPIVEARRRLSEAGLSAEVVQTNVLEWSPAEPVDAVYEQTCLCAIDPSHWPAYAGQIEGWLKPGGQLFAMFMQTNREGGPPFHCGVETMRELFPESRWEWLSEEPLRSNHPVSEEIFEHGYRLRRRSES